VSKQSNSKLITGTVQDNKNGKVYEHAVMITDAMMETIIKVQNITNYPNAPMQLFIECLALDGVGCVFELEIHFPFLDIEEHSQMLESFTNGSVWKMKGMFAIGSDEGQTTIILVSPEYHSLAPEDISDVKSAFRINGKDMNTGIDD